MCLGFAMVEGAAGPHGDVAFVALQGARPAAGGAGLFVAELLGLLLGGGFESAGHQSLHGGHGHVFHLGQIDIESGTVFAPLLADDDFSPALGQVGDVLEIFGGEFACGHVASLQGVLSVRLAEILS